MTEHAFEIKVPLSWLPAALIGWYAPGRVPVALVTSWFAVVGGTPPRIRTAWHGGRDSLSRFWAGGDFTLNVPHESGLNLIREVVSRGKFCLRADEDLGYLWTPGSVAVAPRLVECLVQIECVGGSLIDEGYDADLLGEVVCMHGEQGLLETENVAEIFTSLGCRSKEFPDKRRD